jgi:hypothetical protein
MHCTARHRRRIESPALLRQRNHPRPRKVAQWGGAGGSRGGAPRNRPTETLFDGLLCPALGVFRASYKRLNGKTTARPCRGTGVRGSEGRPHTAQAQMAAGAGRVRPHRRSAGRVRSGAAVLLAAAPCRHLPSRPARRAHDRSSSPRICPDAFVLRAPPQRCRAFPLPIPKCSRCVLCFRWRNREGKPPDRAACPKPGADGESRAPPYCANEITHGREKSRNGEGRAAAGEGRAF